MKKAVSFAMAVAMTASLTVAGAAPVLAGDDVSITIFNSKMEIQSQLEEKAAEYAE